jgi:tRNA uridine 5-carbamoylmethylation protein Kti12
MVSVNSQNYEFSENTSIRMMINKYSEYDKAMKINNELMIILNEKRVKLEDIDSIFVKENDKIVLLHSIAGG